MKKRAKLALFFAPKVDAEDRLDKAQEKVLKKEKWRLIKKKMFHDYFLVYPEDFKKILEEVSFKISRLDMIRTHHIFFSRISFNKWMSAWLPHLQFIDLNYNSAKYVE